MKAFRAIVHGRVQMVMYRDFAQRNARSRGVVGTVRNLKDGTVEVMAEGGESILNEYVERLKKGSLLSRVEKVNVEWREPMRGFSDFEILY
ncbi:acylphosphatase [Candidatus Kaiserbacteria bacterium]|nr:acylphosphatase [Candidatus Kaiserbacteria bacterium]